MAHWWLWAIGGYVCGSVPFGLIIGLSRGVDIRKAGSGNVGATNTARLLGKGWGGLCFALDVLKGLAPVLLAGQAMGLTGLAHIEHAQAWRWLAVGVAAMVGHVFPVWLKLRGGKGVATGLGVLLGVWPILTVPGLAAMGTWLLLAATFRYASLASMGAAVALPLYLVAAGQIRGQAPAELAPFLVAAVLMATLVVVRHRSNVSRLLAGAEPQLGVRRVEKI